MNPEIEHIIVKFISREATAEEMDKLEYWLESDSNEKQFQTYVKLKFAIDYNLQVFNEDKVYEKHRKNIKKERKIYHLKKVSTFLGYAAALVLIIFAIESLVFNYTQKHLKVSGKPQNVVELHPGESKAILTLDDGTEVALTKGSVYKNNGINSNGEQLSYDREESSEAITYNYLTVPRGGQFFMQLSDGTKVWLNSDSKLKYPKNFHDNEARRVELLYGEAYFEVSPSKLHNGSLFEVNNGGRVIQVLGTQFNLKSYQDEKETYTTLVEGKIRLRADNADYNLKPNDQVVFNKETTLYKKRTVDVYNEISWKDGIFSFEDKNLEEIMQVLSRWYDIDILFKNEEVKQEEFVGVLSKNQSIEQILESIKIFGILSSYEIQGKTIILN
ncbi:FecR family protein [Leeuwenhoekiella marinoflava]|uniref:FecR family protein n=2 Tax=Leeuwenhoekiella marinoflava TaxID=988 RepID=A0A4Q0PPY9_9FLAO|nr:FecR family protein [Leeuwenhoekiella marinoflava]RXG32272.1 FecR family protein [Leeuwenhoekiella marinoflava]SHE81022.1 FecR family protein [Leeuwenhoekiella marinoflava DSM 3653]